jgi:bifunctional non-homologous end joining protein LigD
VPKSTAKLAPPPRYNAQLALLVDHAPEGDQWLHEEKLDGYRIGCRIEAGKVQLISRRDQDWTASFPTLRDAAAKLKVKNALIDGEVAVVHASGRTDFQALQNAFKFGVAVVPNVVYFAFDLLFIDGENLMGLPLEERKARLEKLLGGERKGTLRWVSHILGKGPKVFAGACERDLEGIVSKRRDARYHPGKRDPTWVKTKCTKRQEFVIGGFTDPEGSREGIGALLVGYYTGDDLVFAGKVGTGYSQALARELRAKLGRIEQMDCPFSKRPAGWLRWNAHWVSPRLVGEVAFTEWTRDGTLRHPSFKGLRKDKKAKDVQKEFTKSGDV